MDDKGAYVSDYSYTVIKNLYWNYHIWI
jgi:hypothetical protein